MSRTISGHTAITTSASPLMAALNVPGDEDGDGVPDQFEGDH